MMLIDSNIIIYASKPESSTLRQFIVQHTPAVSAVSYVEVLGYHRLNEFERKRLEAFFAAALEHKRTWSHEIRRTSSGLRG